MASVESDFEMSVFFGSEFSVPVTIDPDGRCVIVPGIWSAPVVAGQSRPASATGIHVTAMRTDLRMPSRWQTDDGVSVDVHALMADKPCCEVDGSRYDVVDVANDGRSGGAGTLLSIRLRGST